MYSFLALLLHAAVITAERASERAPEATIKGRSQLLASTTSTYSISLACFSRDPTTGIRLREFFEPTEAT